MCKRRRKPLSGLRRRRRHMLTRHVAREYKQGGRGSPLPAYASVSIPDPVYGTENESDEKLMSEQEDDVAQFFFSFLSLPSYSRLCYSVVPAPRVPVAATVPSFKG